VLRLLRGPLGLLFGISVAGSFAQRTFLTMTPIIVARSGGSEAAGAAVLSAYLGAQAIGTLASGVLTDRFDRQRMLMVLSALAVPAHLTAVLATPAGPLAFGAAIASGFLTMALLPPIVVIAQEMVPSGTAASSGVVMGLAWAFGALGIPLAGALGDAIGPAHAAAWAMPAFFIGTLCAAQSSLRPYRHAPEIRASRGG
jgi:MFS family permease